VTGRADSTPTMSSPLADIGAAFGAFLRGEVFVGDDVGDADPAAGGQHAVGLGEHGGFGDREINDTVKDHKRRLVLAGSDATERADRPTHMARIALSYRIAGVAVGNVRVSDAGLVEGRWVGLGFAAVSPAGSPRTAAVVRGSRGELGEEFGVGVGLAEAVEEHVDGLLAVPALEGPAQGAGGYHFFGGQQ
jgi:hypothetical protein